MVRVGVANRTITPPCPRVHTLIFRDFDFFFSYPLFMKLLPADVY